MSEALKDTGSTGIGAPVRRREDLRFITGNGKYTDDLNQPGQLYGVFCRSPFPRARIDSIDTADALATPGVVAVYTGQQMVDDGIGDLPCGWLVKSKDGSEESTCTEHFGCCLLFCNQNGLVINWNVWFL